MRHFGRFYFIVNSPGVLRRLAVLCPLHVAVVANDLLRVAVCARVAPSLHVLSLRGNKQVC